MDRILIRGELLGPFQHLYVFQKDRLIEKIGVNMNDLAEVTFALINRYQIKNINLSGGPRVFMEGIERQLRQAGIDNYNLDDLTFKYI